MYEPEHKPITIDPKVAPPNPITLSAPFARWDREIGDIDHDPYDSGVKLRRVLILN